MLKDNYERMIKLADEFFKTKNDSSQISMTLEVMERLRKIHPGTLTEKRSKNGPVAWIALIPTTKDLMRKFTSGQITEKELLEATPTGARYDALYLCSALVLPEYRRKGLAKSLVSKGVKSIMKKHPIKYLFYWEFSLEGKRLASVIAREFQLPLYTRASAE